MCALFVFGACVCVCFFVVCLWEQASVPYLEMLETWIYDGSLNDQYGETFLPRGVTTNVFQVSNCVNTQLTDRSFDEILDI